MDYEDLLELVRNRRSIRRFKTDPIPDEYVDKIIEAACWAPSGLNLQPWEFFVVKKKELKDGIVQAIIDSNRAQHPGIELTREASQGDKRQPSPGGEPTDFRIAPAFILLFGDTRTKAGLPMLNETSPHGRESILNSSLANAFLYMHLAATTLGLASQWVSKVQVPLVHYQLKNLLGIPDDLEVYDMMAVGYPAEKPEPKLMRDREKMVHYDSCGKEDFRTDEEVNEFTRRTRVWTNATKRRG